MFRSVLTGALLIATSYIFIIAQAPLQGQQVFTDKYLHEKIYRREGLSRPI